jgi:uncharacterized protein with TBP-like fold DUF4468
MRALFFAVALMLVPPVLAADAPEPPMPTLPDGQFGYEGVVEVAGVSADDLHARAKGFVVDAYKSANAVVQMDDPQLHRIVVRGVFKISWMTSALTIDHKLTIEEKDGRYRYRLDGFLATWPSGDSRSLQDKWIIGTKVVTRTAAECESLIASMKAAMAQPAKDW